MRSRGWPPADGAAMCLLASREKAEALGLEECRLNGDGAIANGSANQRGGNVEIKRIMVIGADSWVRHRAGHGRGGIRRGADGCRRRIRRERGGCHREEPGRKRCQGASLPEADKEATLGRIIRRRSWPRPRIVTSSSRRSSRTSRRSWISTGNWRSSVLRR